MAEVVTVFGGGGFLGSAIVDSLLLKGHAVRVLERPRIQPHRTFGDGEKVEWFEGDFGHLPDIQMALEQATAVIHLVCTTRPKSSNDEPIYDVQSNVISTLQLIQEMRDLGIKKSSSPPQVALFTVLPCAPRSTKIIRPIRPRPMGSPNS